MPRSAEELELLANMEREFRLAQAPAMRAIEREVCGCAYGGTSWTTRAQAEDLAGELGLAPEVKHLEVGAGAGWPALHVAGLTGCDVTLADIPLEGLKIARERANEDGLAKQVRTVVADGSALPFPNDSFETIGHSDVLCCLPEKIEMLRDCLRVLKPGGRMGFTMIAVADGLSADEEDRALAAGPSFVDAPQSYADMLAQTGWTVRKVIDLTQEYKRTMAGRLREEKKRPGEIAELYGEDVRVERLRDFALNLAAIRDGLLVRQAIIAEPSQHMP